MEGIETFQIAVAKPGIVETAVYSIKDSIRATGFSRTTLYRAEKDGKLKVRAQGRRRYLLGADLLEWLKGGEIK